MTALIRRWLVDCRFGLYFTFERVLHIPVKIKKGTTMPSCVICEIVAGRLPSWVIYQDSNVICFLPKTLEAYGQTVIAPKAHHSDLLTTPDHLLGAIINTAKKLAIHYNNKISSSGVNILHASGVSAQQSVLHLHIHLIPRFENDGLNAWPSFSAIECDKDDLLQKLKLSE
ncbi:MAG: HIT family protein [Acidobacteriota bacterium]